MNYLTETEAQRLFEEALKAMENTYSPYSGFPVGAAVLANDGTLIHGTNVENASYGITICAERVALAHAVSMGKTEIRAIAVCSSKDSTSPCGACRQFIIEFGMDIIIVFKNEQQIIQKTIGELLPFEFTRKTMD